MDHDEKAWRAMLEAWGAWHRARFPWRAYGLPRAPGRLGSSARGHGKPAPRPIRLP